MRNVATKVIFMENGKIIEEGTPKEVFYAPKSERVREFISRMERIEGPNDYTI